MARDTSGNMYHARNLDYGFVGLLHNITIEVDFQRSGTTVYTGTTFAGFVGLMTGQRTTRVLLSLLIKETRVLGGRTSLKLF